MASVCSTIQVELRANKQKNVSTAQLSFAHFFDFFQNLQRYNVLNSTKNNIKNPPSPSTTNNFVKKYLVEWKTKTFD